MPKHNTQEPLKIAVSAFAVAFLFSGTAQAQPAACPSRGELFSAYCDANNDMVADTPAVTVNPDRLYMGVSSVEDARVAQSTYGPFVSYLATCLKKEVLLYPPIGEASVLEAMRTGQVHIAQYATGSTMFAVNHTGAVPYAGKGLDTSKRRDTYTLMLLVRADSPYKKPADLKGKKVAHTSATSNSGNLAPRALFPSLGLTPDKDYTVEFSGKHDKSIMGVQLGLYDGAAIASDVFDRMLAKNEIKRNQFRVIFESEEFPPDALSMAHNLDPKLAANITKCTLDYKFPDTMSKALEGNNRFFPVNYQKDWALVRSIAKDAKTPMDRAAYEKIMAGKK